MKAIEQTQNTAKSGEKRKIMKSSHSILPSQRQKDLWKFLLSNQLLQNHQNFSKENQVNTQIEELINLINELQNLIKTFKTTITNIKKKNPIKHPNYYYQEKKNQLQNIDTDQLEEQRKKKIKNQLKTCL